MILSRGYARWFHTAWRPVYGDLYVGQRDAMGTLIQLGAAKMRHELRHLKRIAVEPKKNVKPLKINGLRYLQSPVVGLSAPFRGKIVTISPHSVQNVCFRDAPLPATIDADRPGTNPGRQQEQARTGRNGMERLWQGRAGAALLLALVLVPAPPPRAAEPFPDFTFRRVAPPEPGATRRITVQITEPPPAPPVARAPAAEGAGPSSEGTVAGTAAWFWATVSPEITAAGPGRWLAALAHMEGAPEAASLSAPSLETLRAIADAHGRDILVATLENRVSPALVLAVIAVESSGRADALSPKGAQGLMQLIPDTAARFGVSDSTDPAQNIRGGSAYLDWLLTHFDGDPILALAGYNAGEGAVTRGAGVPNYPETRAYVPKVLAAWRVARLLCATPPELPRDGCVFALPEG